ncbi:hypothetical protein SERLADRAFT_403191 [Serpula lacrymans var. lacrymans S7.9]|uniref:Uncharacterized protein n=1 Tax=Serpula lacrymans var. lacrymans (strain S7.9) TaxID=578457 RepID=F8PCR5_SERL9|nr:uncharacterized protein SERLADRAFT_403191 [Serpula lacrymans var. lacrymans S7.9]EGO19014.1 hypothetical protein SERLADRAFT_403191 [Serpula lacrymans var. lacrymans S7.9]
MVRFDGRSSCKAAHGFLRKAASTKNATREAQLIRMVGCTPSNVSGNAFSTPDKWAPKNQ